MKRIQLKNHHGFTLIELMIVVAIVGILAMFAIPAYQSYTEKARFTQVVTAIAATKTAVEICVQMGNALDDCDGSSNGVPADIEAADGIVGVTTANGVITATKPNDAAIEGDGTYTLTPNEEDNGNLSWAAVCVPATLC
ncbi:prepilin-type N-terminal cleavage/methylation domain-containing protein [Paraglaciecola aquimarina]|uniref:Prepilin-type N-terminal cleavage/methylation domain-containing protein n=1 Tax=Paraglaciecola aquimarina TaxID=1235557 RepID=A0ABU3SWB2_9ALTE|nr:prepilin-type N-terminal cleavage/methylation domain-containing protein [Paraglaciecola aquimarina]MDU0354301.1 prepilin-type N-terminal cleavage/methylation domain-containing protein [Paraglaciecola aquimarina]